MVTPDLSGTYTYSTDTTGTSSYGAITFSDKAQGKLPVELRNSDFFNYIFQRCRFYPINRLDGIICDHPNWRVTGWNYDSGNEFQKAPRCNIIKSFLWSVQNSTGSNIISISLDRDLPYISDNVITNVQAIVSMYSPDNDYGSIAATVHDTGWDMITIDTIGSMQMLSHFIDCNVFNDVSYRSGGGIWVDNIDIFTRCDGPVPVEF